MLLLPVSIPVGALLGSRNCGNLLVDTRNLPVGAPPEVQYTNGTLYLQLRDFLQRSLYDDPDQGYFTAEPLLTSAVGKALASPQLAGEGGYQRAVREAYNTWRSDFHAPPALQAKDS